MKETKGCFFNETLCITVSYQGPLYFGNYSSYLSNCEFLVHVWLCCSEIVFRSWLVKSFWSSLTSAVIRWTWRWDGLFGIWPRPLNLRTMISCCHTLHSDIILVTARTSLHLQVMLVRCALAV